MSILAQPRDLAELSEIDPALPDGAGEWWSGYGVLGLPFSSGHVLALRRFPASSLGRGYTGVWHRDPLGHWTFWSNQPPELSCARYFAGPGARVMVSPIRIRWTGPQSFHVRVGEHAIEWSVDLLVTPMALLFNALAGLLPDAIRGHPSLLDAMGRIAGPLLRAGRIRLTGISPTGRRFRASAERAWIVERSSAMVAGHPIGDIGPLPVQAALGDFLIPQRGIFVVGQMHFD